MKLKVMFLYKVFAIVGFASFSGCKDTCKGIDTSPQTITYTIEEDAKAKFPFKHKDTQIYISNMGDTVILFGKLYAGYESKDAKNTIECFKPITWNAENLSYYATGNNLELNMIEFILGAEIGGAIPGENVINFRINGNIPEIGQYGYFYLDPINLNNVSYYTDSIMVDGAYFYGKPSIQPNQISFLYNYNYGFLKIEFFGGKTWTKVLSQ